MMMESSGQGSPTGSKTPQSKRKDSSNRSGGTSGHRAQGVEAAPPPPTPQPPPPRQQRTSNDDGGDESGSSNVLPVLARSLVQLTDKVAALGATLAEVHADMAALKAQYGVLAAAAQGCASYGVQMTVTFTPQPLQSPSPAPSPHHHHQPRVAPFASVAAPSTNFVDQRAAPSTRTVAGDGTVATPQTRGSGAHRSPAGAAKKARNRKRALAPSMGAFSGAQTAAASGGGGNGDSQPPPSKKQKRDKRDKMFVFLDHINNTRVSSDNSDGEDDSDGGTREQAEDELELKIVAGSSDDETEEAAVATATAAVKEEEDDVAETSESEMDDGEDGMGEEEGDGSDSSTTIASAGEPQHDQPIKWVSSEQPASGRGINQRLMPEKITKLEHLTVFWKRIKQSIKCDTKSGKGCWICTCPRPTPNSYVRKSIGGHKFFAHALTYVVWNRTIDLSLPVVQLCGDRLCLNPDHLSQVAGGPLDTDQRTDCLVRRTLETCPFSPPCVGHRPSLT